VLTFVLEGDRPVHDSTDYIVEDSFSPWCKIENIAMFYALITKMFLKIFHHIPISL